MQMDLVALHRKWLSRPIFNWLRKRLPSMSDTKREALEAGDVWWDAELFTGNPDWSKLLDTPPPALSKEEKKVSGGPYRAPLRYARRLAHHHIRGEPSANPPNF